MRERRRAYHAATLPTPRVGSAATPLDRGWGPGPAAAQLPRCLRRLCGYLPPPRSAAASAAGHVRACGSTFDRLHRAVIRLAAHRSPAGQMGRPTPEGYRQPPARRREGRKVPCTPRGQRPRPDQEQGLGHRRHCQRRVVPSRSVRIVVYAATSTPYAQQDRTSRTLSCRAPQLRPLPATTPTSARGPVFVFFS